jgi:ABC-type transport system substrate-binding protein
MWILLLLPLAACDGSLWNDPYPAAEGGKSILYTAITVRPKHLDPAQAYSDVEYDFLAHIYAPPLQYHYLKRPYQLVPLSASEMPRVTFQDKQHRPLPDNTAPGRIAFSVYEIHLKPGLRYQPHPAFVPSNYLLLASDWHNISTLGDFSKTGTRPVIAADYAYQIKRLVHPQLNSPIASVMSEYIVGLKDYAAALQAASKAHPDAFLDLNQFPLPGVEVVNESTYRITIHGKYPQFAYWLAMPFFAPMPQEAERFYALQGMRERNLSLDWWPVGSGPYYLSENEPNRRMVLTKNPYYESENYPSEGEIGDAAAGLLADAGKPLPLIDHIVFSMEKETIPYWNKFLQGYYDASGISSDSFDQAVQIGAGGEANVSEGMKAQGISLVTSVEATDWYTGFNMLDSVVGGSSEQARKLRLAISIAVDFEEFVSIFANGRGISAHSPIPPGIFGHGEGCADINTYVYDCVQGSPKRKPIEEAKRLLAEAGYPGGVSAKTKQPLVIHFDTTPGYLGIKAQSDWIRKQFDKIGVQLDVRSTDSNRFQDKLRHGDTQLFFMGWNADYPDPENFLFLLHGAQAKVSKGGENYCNYSNPEFDRLFEQMKNMDNSPARKEIINRMLEILRHDAPWMWGYHSRKYVLKHGWLHNIKAHAMANNRLKYWRVDSVQRDQLRGQWNQPVRWPLWLGGMAMLLFGGWMWRVLQKREEAK